MPTINLKEMFSRDENIQVQSPKNIIYTNPMMVLLPLTDPLVDYVRNRIKVDNISFVKNLCNYYFTGSYMKRIKDVKGHITDAEMLAFNDGMSMMEISNILITEYDAYFNPAIVSIQFDPEFWKDVLLSATKTVNYQYLDVPYQDYAILCDKNKIDTSVIVTKNEYNSTSELVRIFVEHMNFLSTSKQHSNMEH